MQYGDHRGRQLNFEKQLEMCGELKLTSVGGGSDPKSSEVTGNLTIEFNGHCRHDSHLATWNDYSNVSLLLNGLIFSL